MSLLKGAFLLIQLLNLVFGMLDGESKKKAAQALSEAENLKNDLAAVHKANAASAAVPVDPDSLRVPNADSRT